MNGRTDERVAQSRFLAVLNHSAFPAQVFAQARKPGIYKEDYLVDLFSRYGMEGESPPPPALPAWCKEYDDDDEDDDGGGGNSRENGSSE